MTNTPDNHALAGKTILVTGGANGIGKACALLAGELGANVLVNDIGSNLTGEHEGEASAAEAVAETIRDQGGRALSNTNSVSDFDAVQDMISQCLDNFGSIDAIINPAGILRDGMFHKMDPANWDSVIDVHLRGSFNVARASVNHFREQAKGNYVFFGSTSGLIGNLGQSNYAAAKMGIVGLSKILAMEGAAKNTKSNVIAPFAWTRMIASIPVKDEESAKRVERIKQSMRADQVAQFALALCNLSDDGPSGQIFGVRGNEVILFGQPRPVTSISRTNGWTLESIDEHLLPSMKSKFTNLEPSASVFPYDPV